MVARRDHDMLELSVIDDGAGIGDEAAIPKGHGIDNTRERLRSLYGERASLTLKRRAAGGTSAILVLPFRDIVWEPDVETH